MLVGAASCSEKPNLLGELICTAARVRGARGAVLDGYARDLVTIAKMKFPIFAIGTSPRDTTGRSTPLEYGRPVMCGDVLVNEGDIVLADTDGVVVIPRAVEKQAIDMAFAKASAEDTVRDELLAGNLLGDVYKKYGVL